MEEKQQNKKRKLAASQILYIKMSDTADGASAQNKQTKKKKNLPDFLNSFAKT